MPRAPELDADGNPHYQKRGFIPVDPYVPEGSPEGDWTAPIGPENYLPPNPLKRHNWEAISQRYIEGRKDPKTGELTWPTLAEIAEEFGVGQSVVRDASARMGWSTQKANFQNQVEASRRAAKANALTVRATRLDGSALTTSELGLQLCSAKIQGMAEKAQKARAAGGPGGGAGGDAIDALEMTRVAQAADLFHKIGLRAVGDPETHRVELTGANGKPIQIAAELQRDDPARMSSVLSVLKQAGLGEVFSAAEAASVAAIEGGS